MRSVPTTPRDGLELLVELGAVPWLVRHHELVVEAATLLCDRLARALPHALFDRALVLVGAALHDAGKVVVPEEMHLPGHQHEVRGRELLEGSGLPPALTRFCVTHASWDAPDCTLEDLLVALADKLRKGKRDEALEKRVLADIVEHSNHSEWEAFDKLDALCEAIAADGPARLARSNV